MGEKWDDYVKELAILREKGELTEAEELALKAVRKYQDSNREDESLLDEFFRTTPPTEENVEGSVFLCACLYGGALIRLYEWMGKEKAEEIHQRVVAPRIHVDGKTYTYPDGMVREKLGYTPLTEI